MKKPLFHRKKKGAAPREVNAELLPAVRNDNPLSGAMQVQQEEQGISSDGVEVKPFGPLLMVKTDNRGALSTTIPTDEEARHLAKTPEQKKREKKRFIGPHTPKIHCDNCAYNSACPYFKPGYECAFESLLAEHQVDSEEAIAHYLKVMTETELQRAQLAVIQERLSGGMLDKETSRQLDVANTRLTRLYEMLQSEKPRVNVLQKSSPLFQQLNAFVTPGEKKPTSLLEQILSSLQSVPRVTDE